MVGKWTLIISAHQPLWELLVKLETALRTIHVLPRRSFLNLNSTRGSTLDLGPAQLDLPHRHRWIMHWGPEGVFCLAQSFCGGQRRIVAWMSFNPISVVISRPILL